MYIALCVYSYVSTYACKYVCISAYVHTHTHTHIYIYIYTRTYALIYILAYIYMCVCIDVRTCGRMYACTPMYLCRGHRVAQKRIDTRRLNVVS